MTATPQYRVETAPAGVSVQLFTACVIAREFRNVPTVAQLRDRFGMHRATAHRWIAAIKAARGIA